MKQEFITFKPWRWGNKVFMYKMRVTVDDKSSDKWKTEIKNRERFGFIRPTPQTKKELLNIRIKKVEEMQKRKAMIEAERQKQELEEKKRIAKDKENEITKLKLDIQDGEKKVEKPVKPPESKKETKKDTKKSILSKVKDKLKKKGKK